MTNAGPSSRLNKASGDSKPTLDELTRERLGRQLQAMYAPVLDEVLDPRLAEIMQQLERDRES